MNPELKIIMSTGVISISLANAVENDPVKSVKYEPVDISSTIINTINGYMHAINHVRRNSILSINASPKNITKYNSMDIIN